MVSKLDSIWSGLFIFADETTFSFLAIHTKYIKSRVYVHVHDGLSP